MSKLYYENPYLKSFIAEIIEIIEKDTTYHIVLNQTGFYPDDGIQPCDTGFIEDCPITHVYEENERIYHVSPKKPIKIHKAKCHIDWHHRFDYMQQHLAQHLLSACLLEDYKAKTLSFRLDSDLCTLDIDQVLNKEQLNQLEAHVNHIINEDFPVNILYPTKQELKKLPFKQPLPKVSTPLRLIQVEDLDLTACYGIHPRSTLEVGLLNILKSEKYKGGLRLTFLAGRRAINALLQKDITYVQELEYLKKECIRLENENRHLKDNLLDYEVMQMIASSPVIKGIHIISKVYEDVDPKLLQTTGSKLVKQPNVIALLGLKLDKISHLSFMCSSNLQIINMSTLLKDSITLLDGRGGGTPFSAQGGGKSASNVESALEYAVMKVKAILS